MKRKHPRRGIGIPNRPVAWPKSGPSRGAATRLKYLSVVTASVQSVAVPMLLSTLARQCYIEAADLGHGAKGLAAAILPMAEIAGVKVGPG